MDNSLFIRSCGGDIGRAPLSSHAPCRKRITLPRVTPTMTCRGGCQERVVRFCLCRQASTETPPSNLMPYIVSCMRQQLHAWQALPQAPFSLRSPMQHTRFKTSLRSNIVYKKNSLELSAFPSSPTFGFDKQLKQIRTQPLFNTQDCQALLLQLAVRPAHKPSKPTHPAHVIAPGSTHTNPCKDIKHTELNSRALFQARKPNHNHETHGNNQLAPNNLNRPETKTCPTLNMPKTCQRTSS